MVKLLPITGALLMVYSVHSYILLTANIEDLQNVAKRLVQSPLSAQVGSVFRRAYGIFNNHLSKALRKSGDAFSPEEPIEDRDFRRKNSKDNEVDGSEKKEQKYSKERKEQNEPKKENEMKKQSEQKEQSEQRDQKVDQLNGTRTDEFSTLRSASAYLGKIKKVFDDA